MSKECILYFFSVLVEIFPFKIKLPRVGESLKEINASRYVCQSQDMILEHFLWLKSVAIC